MAFLLTGALPNSDERRIKVYPNEYINNITINRPNLRLLANDLYLNLKLNTAILAISGLLPSISGMSINMVPPPISPEASGTVGEISLKDDYFYIYNPILNNKNWGRIQLEYNW